MSAAPRSLRPHQVQALHLLRQSLRKKKRRPVLMMPTGAGKTLTAANIIRMALAKENRVAFCVPAVSLIDQTVEEFWREGVRDVGVIQADHPMQDYSKPVQVCSIQTLEKRKFPDVSLVIVDECHRQFGVIKRWMEEEPELPFIGLSATPWAAGMGKQWDDLLIPTTINDLIEQGFLSPFRAYAAAHPDLTGVRISAGDYNGKDLGEAMNQSGLVADVVESWLKHGEGRPTLVFAVDRAHAKALQGKFTAAGVGAGYIDAFTERDERKAIERQLERGEISVVCNVGCLTTGVDWDVRCIVLARPTRSEMLFVQMIGRGLRTAEGKADCIILDHADNHLRMGFVTDIRHDKLSDGRKAVAATRQKKEPLPSECPSCSFLKPPKVHKCPACGFAPEKQSAVEAAEGELVPINGRRLYTMAEKQVWLSGLVHIAEERGRKPGWAAWTYKEKFGVWPDHSLEKVPAEPTQEVRNYVRAKDIRFVKGLQKSKQKEAAA